MAIVISHPTGNANVRAAVEGLFNENLLLRFYTSIASFQGTPLDNLGNMGALSEIHRRRFDLRLKPYTHTLPWIEMGRLAASKLPFLNFLIQKERLLSIDEVYRSMDKHVASKLKDALDDGASAVYAYEDAAKYTFTRAKQLGINCLYDLPIGYWRSARLLLDGEKERWPEWASTLTGFGDSEAKLIKKDDELRLADCIFAASTFTARTLGDYPGQLAPVKVIPYGFPAVNKGKRYDALGGRPLKLLFVGGLSQRKGIADLFEVAGKMGRHVELTIVGRKTVNNCRVLDAALAKHRWIASLPHSQVLEMMREHDVLVFPSLFEGFGLVITEAMAQGTPVLTTDRTAGPDIIESDRNGWVIEAGTTERLQEAVEYLLSNPEKIASNGKDAMETARMRPWNVYGRELAEAINGVNKFK